MIKRWPYKKATYPNHVKVEEMFVNENLSKPVKASNKKKDFEIKEFQIPKSFLNQESNEIDNLILPPILENPEKRVKLPSIKSILNEIQFKNYPYV